MSKKDFIWIFSDTSLRDGINGPFSLEYYISRIKAFVDVSKLVDSRIWLIIKTNNRLFLFAFITPATVEQYVEGPYSGDFLLQANPFNSVRLLPRNESVDSWSLDNLQNEDEGIRECTGKERAIFLNKLSHNYRSSFSNPSRSILSSIPKTSFSDPDLAIPDQMKLVLRTIAFGDVTRSQSFPESVSAFGGTSLALLQDDVRDIYSPENIKLMASLDPFSSDSAVEPKSIEDILKTSSGMTPMVDTYLEEIDPEKIFPRVFYARSKTYSLDWLDKTNEAEKKHEEIIKDLAIFLKSENIKTYKSRSFDLFTEKSELKCLWEIKSTNDFNTLEQGEKGIIQLLRYSVALSDVDYKNVRFVLLLQNNGQDMAFSCLSKMAKIAGVELWFYDKNVEWPKRIYSINEDLSPLY